jgi:hypothetical protein
MADDRVFAASRQRFDLHLVAFQQAGHGEDVAHIVVDDEYRAIFENGLWAMQAVHEGALGSA